MFTLTVYYPAIKPVTSTSTTELEDILHSGPDTGSYYYDTIGMSK